MAGAFFTSVASNLVAKLGEYLIAPIGRQFGYVLCYDSYVEDLKNRVEELESARKRVQHSVDEATYDGKSIYTDIQDWLGSVTKEAKEAQKLLAHGKSAKNACFRGCIPNPVVRHPIGRKVSKMTKVIQGLHQRRSNSIFQKVFYENTPKGIVTASTSAARSVDNDEDVLESRALITEEVIKALGDKKFSVIGVYGPGGVGKSKLLADVERQVKERQLFDVVVIANVSRTPDLKRIQGEIASQLGLKLINEETAHGRADRLRERLEADSKKKILVILDNLWKKLELNEVGIPCRYDNKVRGCKLLLSSRNGEILRSDMGSDQEFRLKELEDGEARRLFERTLGERVNNPEFKPLVDGVVKNCGNLPLFIISLAKRLRKGKLAAWRNALNIEGSDFKSLVELNYKDIKDERIRSLFLVGALASGSTVDSLVYCMGLGLFEKLSRTIEDARDRLIMDLQLLRDSSLLLDSDDMEELNMHDTTVDVAISIASTEWKALVGREDCGFKEWSEAALKKCTAMSFPYVGIDELPEKLSCPNLRMLILYEDNQSLKVPDSFFESMEKLQVLDLSSLSFPSLPLSIQLLENLKSLSLDFCHLGNVADLGKLKGLQFLSFKQSTITQLPKEIGELTELRYLNLTGCTELVVIEPGVLESLVNMEELYMEDTFDQWEAEDETPRSNASLAELKNMKKLSTLYITIPHFANLLKDLPFGKLNRHKIQIGDIWDWSGDYKESRTFKLKLDSGDLLFEEWVQSCLQTTQDLHLDGLQYGNDSIHDLCLKGFQQLKNLYVRNNPSLQYVVPSTNNVAFTALESLFLENLNLEKICHGCLAPNSFSKLKTLKVDNCGRIKHLFPRSMMRIFLQLEEIEISKCHLMQQIVADAEIDEDEDEMDDVPNVKPCNLHRLTLRNLPKMTSFYKTMDHSVVFFDQQQVSLPWLESLTLAELPIKEIWNSQLPSDVSNLKFLNVEDCAFLLNIIPSNLLIKLQNLEAITIERCESIQEVFGIEELTVNGDTEVLLRLTKLTLSDLPRLGCIWNMNPRRASCFRNLKALKVQNCEKLRFLFSCSIVNALKQIKEIEIASCKLMEEIMDVQDEESEEAMAADTLEFPHLTSMTIEEMPNLRTFSSGKYCINCPLLTSLRIYGCPKMTTFSSFEEKQQSTTANMGLQQAFGRINSGFSLSAFFNEKVLFPSLEELKLSSMCELKRIWHDQLHGQSFCKLASLTIELCENLSHVFPSNSMERLQSLDKIKVVGCPSLEALFGALSLNTEKSQKPLVLSALKKVKLSNLSKLRDILKSDCTVVLPSLIKVNVRRCHSLTYLFSTATTLDKLSVLDVSHCNNLRAIIGMEEGKGKTVEKLKLCHLTTLKLGDLENLISFSLASCTGDGLRPLFDEKVAFPELEELQINGLQMKELWNDNILADSFCRLKVLKVEQCHNLSNVIPSFMWKRLIRCMESLTVESCNLIERIHTVEGLDVMEKEAARSSPLRELSLCDLPNLTCIWKNEDPLKLCLHNLTSVRVAECPLLRNLFTMCMAKSLRLLQYLSLGGCPEMEYIVVREEKKLEEAAERIVIPQLATLYLHNMPKLRSFFYGKHISEWPSLKEFAVEDCTAVEVIIGEASFKELERSIPMQQSLLLVEKVEFPNMESMKISHMDNVEKIWRVELASNAFTKLKTLVVEHCEKLSSLFSSHTILTMFRNLKELTVTDCGSLEVVFHVQEFDINVARSTSTFKLRKIVLKRLPKLKQVWSGLPRGGLSFRCLQGMEVVECEGLKSLLPSSVAKSMTQLEKLLVRECGVEEIIFEEDGVRMNTSDLFFPQLTDLRLLELPKLRSFYKYNHTSTWPLLKQLRVRECGKMRTFSFACEFQSYQGTSTGQNQPALFSFEKVIPRLEGSMLTREVVEVAMTQHHSIFGSLTHLALSCYHDENVAFPSDFLLQSFPNLQRLIVTCSSFEEIFPEDASGLGGDTPCGGLTDAENPLKALANLEVLELCKLCNLRRVWKDGSLMAEILNQIKYLFVWKCPSLSIIFPTPTSFQRLRLLNVRDCAGLVHMGTCSAVTSLVHLTWLTLRNCGALEDVVTDDGNGAKEISFPELEELILDGLPSLESFSPANCAFRFPALERIVVKQCPKMNKFCKGALRTPKLDKVLLFDGDDEWRWEGDLDTTIRTLST